MIAKTIRPCECVNPAHGIDDQPAKVTLPDGTHPTREMPPIFPLPIGSLLEHPRCWELCVSGTHNAAPVAAPADDECRRAVRDHNEKREGVILEIREAALELDGRGRAGRFMTDLAKSYGVHE